jgi:hypothetical protein
LDLPLRSAPLVITSLSCPEISADIGDICTLLLGTFDVVYYVFVEV